MRLDNLGTYIPHMTLFNSETYPRREINNVQILMVAHTGHGKTLAAEKIAEEFHNCSYTIIYLTEKPGAPFEAAFASFEPHAEYHVKYLVEQQQKPEAKKVKLYHPMTLSPELKRTLPPIKFFQIPLKTMTVQELTVILESETRHDSVRILKNNLERLGRADSILDLMWNADQSIKRQAKKLAKGVSIPKFDEDFLIPSPESGTAKNISDIKSAFDPFMRHYMLTDSDTTHQLDWKAILNDQEHYHIFSRAFIPENDERAVYFVVNWCLNQIEKHIPFMKNPVLIMVSEAKVFLPDKSKEVYIQKTADNFERKLSTMRSSGISSCADSQGYYDLSEGYRNSVNETFIGRLSPADLERYAKALRLPPRMRESISALPKNEWFRKGHNERVTMLFPRHAHKEEGENFIRQWKKHFPQQVHDYKELLQEIQDQKRRHIQKAQKRVEEVKRRLKEKAKQVELDEVVREEQRQGAKDTKQQLLKKKEEQLDNERKIMIFKQSKLNPDLQKPPSWRALGDEHGMNHKTAKKHAEDGKKLLEQSLSESKKSDKAEKPEDYEDMPDEEADQVEDDTSPDPSDKFKPKESGFYKSPGKR